MFRFEVIIYNIHPMQRKHQRNAIFLDLLDLGDLDLDLDLEGEPFLYIPPAFGAENLEM